MLSNALAPFEVCGSCPSQLKPLSPKPHLTQLLLVTWLERVVINGKRTGGQM